MSSPKTIGKCSGSSCNMTMFKEIIYIHREKTAEENMSKCS